MDKLTTLRTHYRRGKRECIYVLTIPFEPITGCLKHYDNPGYSFLAQYTPDIGGGRTRTTDNMFVPVDKWQNIQHEMILCHRTVRAHLKRTRPDGHLSDGSDVLPRLPPKR